jgi:hypothetical protein
MATRERPEPRFFIDHDTIHDRKTGKHVRTGGNVEGSSEDGIEECCALLNKLDSMATTAEHCPIRAAVKWLRIQCDSPVDNTCQATVCVQSTK